MSTCLTPVRAQEESKPAEEVRIEPIRYVTQNGTGDGSSWASASGNLQAMIDAPDVTEVWVAGGLYKPTTGTDRTASFAMKNNVAIYGGFVGNETSRSNRPTIDPAAGMPSSTTLSGDIGTPNDNSDNSYHVIANFLESKINSTAVLEGVIITGGNASGGTSSSADSFGGGIYNEQCSPALINCSLISNSASNGGGGMYNYQSNPILTRCIIQTNSASNGDGGGIYNSSGNPTLTKCSLLNNSANKGGGIYNSGSSPRLTNCSLQSNSATSGGGGINNQSGSSPMLINCSLQANYSANKGGGVYSKGGSNPTLINCSLLSNSASVAGGGIWNDGSDLTLANCVLWDNGGSKTIFKGGSSTVTATYSLFENTVTGYDANGMGNLTSATSPFASANSVALAATSPAIDAGSNQAYGPKSPEKDLVGNTRFFDNGIIDMGAVEFQRAPVPTNTPFAITGVTPVRCETISAGLRRLTFDPQYSGLSGQPISFSVVNEMLPTSAPGPYVLGIYVDNPTITLKATQQGTSGEASFVYNWLAACGTTLPPPSPGGVFAITGVTPVRCETISAGLRRLTFDPQYGGTSGQPISFSVVNEMLPTSAPGPYVLGIYVDNPTITLKATQQGTSGEASFVYNWLAACNSGANRRVGVNELVKSALDIRVLGNPIAAESVAVEVRGAQGQSLRMDVLDQRGHQVSTVYQELAADVERVQVRVGSVGGLYFLHVSTPGQQKTIKLVKP